MPAELISYLSQVLNTQFELKDTCEFCFYVTQHPNPFSIPKTDLLPLCFLRECLIQFTGEDFVLYSNIQIFKM